MRVLAIICNVVSLGFTLLVLATDGPPTKPVYSLLGLCLILIPLLTLFALAGPRSLPVRGTPVLRFAAVGNILLFAFVCWALVDQHPHPNEPGFIPYAVLMLLTPGLSALILFRRRPTELPHP